MNTKVLFPQPLISGIFLFLILLFSVNSIAEESRLLRQPSISAKHVVFVHGGDIWRANLDGSNVLRLTSTPAVEHNPHLSPDGETVAFSSNRSGSFSVYVASIAGGEARRLTWHGDDAHVRGWTPDGHSVLFASGRDTAPRPIQRLWTIPLQGGPATLVNKQWAFNGAFSPDGKKLVIDRVDRWDEEWRNYRGGQNTPLRILDLNTHEVTLIPSNKTIDIEPVWIGEKVYFISDRDWIANVWSYDVSAKTLEQITHFQENDVKQLSSNGQFLAFEQNGYIHTLDLNTNKSEKMEVSVHYDFPWAQESWTDVTGEARAASLSPTGKRALFQSRGEIFTVPIENGAVRNLSQSSHAADRKPIWSPNGDLIAWFSDLGGKG